MIGVLKFFSVEEDIKAYVIWGLGSFARVSGNQMMLFVTIMAVIIPLSFLLIKPLNLLMLGDGNHPHPGPVDIQPQITGITITQHQQIQWLDQQKR